MTTLAARREELGAVPGAAVVAAIVLGAAAAQALRPMVTVAIPGAPWNWLLAGVPATLLLAARWRWPDEPLLRLIGSSSWAIASLLLLGLVCLPLAVWPTGAAAPAWLQHLGLAEATHSLPFAAVWACLVASLATVTGLRLARPAATRAWWRSLAVHLGLLIAAVGAVAAAGTLEKGRLILKERGEAATSLLHDQGPPTAFPVAVTLDDFRLESFAPTVAIAARHGDDWTVTPGEVLLGPAARDTVAGWQVTVDEWLPSSAIVSGTPQPYHEEGAGPAARVTATGPDGAVVRGWLHAPTVYGERLMLLLPDQRALVMADPRPKRFSAAVRVDGHAHTVAVNQPLHVPGWTLYLTSYDESLGAASNIAILEAVRDPALPGVYLGLGLLLVGMALMLTEPSGAALRSASGAARPGASPSGGGKAAVELLAPSSRRERSEPPTPEAPDAHGAALRSASGAARPGASPSGGGKAAVDLLVPSSRRERSEPPTPEAPDAERSGTPDAERSGALP